MDNKNEITLKEIQRKVQGQFNLHLDLYIIKKRLKKCCLHQRTFLTLHVAERNSDRVKLLQKQYYIDEWDFIFITTEVVDVRLLARLRQFQN